MQDWKPVILHKKTNKPKPKQTNQNGANGLNIFINKKRSSKSTLFYCSIWRVTETLIKKAPKKSTTKKSASEIERIIDEEEGSMKSEFFPIIFLFYFRSKYFRDSSLQWQLWEPT